MTGIYIKRGKVYFGGHFVGLLVKLEGWWVVTRAGTGINLWHNITTVKDLYDIVGRVVLGEVVGKEVQDGPIG